MVMDSHLPLAEWLVSGDHALQRDFRIELLTSFVNPRGSTEATYSSAWKLWSNWCVEWNTDPFSVPVIDILLPWNLYYISST